MTAKFLDSLTISAKDVSSFVTRKICLITEAFSTFITSEWLLSSVSSDMSQQITLTVKLLLTKHAGEVPFICVGLSVRVEGTFSRERRRTEVTKVGSDPKMNCINVEL